MSQQEDLHKPACACFKSHLSVKTIKMSILLNLFQTKWWGSWKLQKHTCWSGCTSKLLICWGSNQNNVVFCWVLLPNSLDKSFISMDSVLWRQSREEKKKYVLCFLLLCSVLIMRGSVDRSAIFCHSGCVVPEQQCFCSYRRLSVWPCSNSLLQTSSRCQQPNVHAPIRWQFGCSENFQPAWLLFFLI